MPIDLAISPISLGYYFYGRFALTKTFITAYRCNGCRLCKKECPVSAIKIKNNRPFRTRKCESRMHCMSRCYPKQAIQTPHVLVLVIWWLIILIIPMFFLHETGKIYPIVSEYINLLYYSVLLITGLPVIFFSYNLLHFLMRFKFKETLWPIHL